MAINFIDLIALIRDVISDNDKMSKFREVVEDIKELINDIKDVVALFKG